VIKNNGEASVEFESIIKLGLLLEPC